MANITITIEITEADFREDYSVDSDAPLMDLVRRIAEEEGFPLRTKSGRPIAWTAEGPSWRPGKTELTDLVRTQSLDKIAQRFLEEGGPKRPLFEIILDIPGAAEAIGTRRAKQKLADIDETLEQRKQERLEGMGSGSDFTMDTAEREAIPEPPPPPPPKPVESRIRRAPSPLKKKPKRPKSSGPSQGLLIALGSGGCLLLLVIFGVIAALVMKKEPPPEPVVEAAPAPAPIPVAVPVAPPPPPKVEKATPAPLEMFFNKAKITRSSASNDAARLTSFAKEKISLSYTVRQSAAGSHTVSLKGRFSVTISDAGGIIETTGGHPISKGAAIGKDTRVNISNLSGRVSVKVGGKRYGPYKVKKSNSFPAWKISIKSGATLHNLRASARVE